MQCCKPSAAQAVQRLFVERLGEDHPDEAVQEYVVRVLCDGELDVEELRDMLASFSSCFAALSEEQQIDTVLGLVSEAKATQEPAALDEAPQAAPGSGGLDNCLRQLRTVCLNGQEGPDEAEGSGGDVGTGPPAAAPAALPEAVVLLQGLCAAPLPAGFLAHVLAAKCGGDMEAAAAYLLDGGADLAAEQRAWEAAEARREAERQAEEQERELNRRKIVEKFQLEAVPEGPARRPQQISAWAAKEQGNTKVRYREGQMVSTKGEKYVIEKVGADWDGGSRGKVYTKGKRGKGFM